ncbi:Histone transcription regulator 3 [Orbilia brochopaga]|uniref:Histone transcription regulator 3 homolog n=1 Tax=Orbilia brochopaga TaxID=3140254 RepID=A0AAV9U9S0_9PEZI
MASWTALNIIEDSEDDEVADNTQEIQIEEALKLHQKALKLHSEQEWKNATETFEELFRSEIFQQDQTEDALRLRNILYLAYRGYAEFKLDLLRAKINEYSEAEANKIVVQALEWFGEALARDSEDESLWRKTAKLARRLKSARLSRFALEAVVSKGMESLLNKSSPMNPEELYAAFLLRDTHKETCDELGMRSKAIERVGNKSLNPKYQIYLDLYPWLKPSSQIAIHTNLDDQYDVITVSKKTWTAVGNALLDRLLQSVQDEEVAMERPVVVQLDGEPLELEIPAPTPVTESNIKMSPDGDVAMADDQDSERPAAVRRRSTSTNAKRKGSAVPVDAEGSTRASKRVRNRESNAAAAAAAVTPEITPREAVVLEDRLFRTANELFAEIGVSLGPSSLLKPEGKKEDDDDNHVFSTADTYIKDFKSILVEWDDEKGNVALYGEGIKKPDEEILSLQSFTQTAPSTAQSQKPMLTPEDGLRRWIQRANSQRLQIPELCSSFLRALLSPGKNDEKSKYSTYSWSESLKDVVRMMVDHCNEGFARRFQKLRDDMNEGRVPLTSVNKEIEVAQSLFELSLDNLSSSERDRNSTELSSNDASPLKLKAVRWGTLVGDLMRFRVRDDDGNLGLDPLTLRYLWANVVLVPFTNPSREYLLECYDDLKDTLIRLESPVIEIPNSASMPEISVARAEREISKAKTMDFFANIFASAVQSTDPYEVIEDLEIILEPRIEEYDIDEDGIKNIQEMTKVLETSSVQVKVSLWQKLRDAYHRLGDAPNVLRCRITCMDIIIRELVNPAYAEKSIENRTFILLRAIFWLNETLPGMADEIISDPSKLVNLSSDLQKIALSCIPQVLRLLHVYVFFEDSVVAGEISKSTLHSYRLLTTTINKLLVHCWSLMYVMYKTKVEAPADDEVPAWQEKCIRLASAIHTEIGIRNLCKLHHRVFLKIALKDILDFEIQGSEPELVQCLKCLYNFDVSLDLFDLADHKTDCIKLDRDTALKIFPFVMVLAEKKKSAQVGLKGAMKEAMQTLVDVIGIPSDRDKDVAYNTKMLDETINAPINPLTFYAAFRGGSTPNFVSIRSDYAKVAEKGFFFEYGMSLFIRYKFAKKAQNQDVDDVADVVKYLRYNLVCGNFQAWEPWYRLGQSYEFKFEDDVTYGAEKINTKRDELVALERKILQCYSMALGLVMQDEEPDDADEEEAEERLANKCQLYIDFAMQIYSAVRPPLEREAFLVDGYERYCSGAEGVFTQRAHGDVSLESALKFAIMLFKRAIKEGSTDWKNYYMIAKCYGKLEAEPQTVLSCLSEAVTQAPIRERGEQILEPHYKLVAAVYKYAKSGEIAIQEGYEYLNAVPWLQKNLRDLPQDPASFNIFAKGVYELLNKIRALDKQKWHHRMTYRMARIMYDDIEDHDKAHKELSTFFAHKNQLYTIWKPENERPGRHYVYVHQYLLFWTQMLGETNDKPALEGLVKKLKKQGPAGGCWKQPEVWDKVVITYAKVLRKVNGVEENMEVSVYENVTYDEFNTYSAKMEEHFEVAENQKGATFELLKDTYDLKKLNTGQTKTAIIDDLLTDTYSLLYREVVPGLVAKLAGSTEVAANGSVGGGGSSSGGMGAGGSTNPMSLHNLVDSGSEAQQQQQQQQQQGSAAVVLAAAHGRIDDYLGRKMTRVGRKDVLQKVNSMFRTIFNMQNSQNAAKLVMAGRDAAMLREGSKGSGSEFKEAGQSPVGREKPVASPSSEDADDEGADDEAGDNTDANITLEM